MLETLLGISVVATPTDLGLLAALTSIIVQVLKQIVPKKFPTSILATIVALIVTVTATIIVYGLALNAIAVGVIAGFMVAFVSTNGFDSLKKIWDKYNLTIPDKDEEEGGNG